MTKKMTSTKKETAMIIKLIAIHMDCPSSPHTFPKISEGKR
jgi:hypothetical protein